jgi:hypothetical protein
MNFRTINTQRKSILIAAVVGIIAMFLPWVKITFFGISSSMNGMHRKEGIFVFFCFIGAAILALLGDRAKNLDKKFWLLAQACGALASLIMGWNFIESREAGMSYLSVGFYLAGLASIAILLFAYIFRKPGDSIKSGFESLKKEIEDKARDTGIK